MTNKPWERGRSSPLPESRTARGRIEEPVSAGGVVYRLADGKVETVLCGLISRSRADGLGEGTRPAYHGKQDGGKQNGGKQDGGNQGSGNQHSKKTPQGLGQEIRWSLAKGTPDSGESLEETALREVREETGLEVEIQEPIKSIDYWFAERGGEVRYHKTVHFYLMVPVGGDIALHDPEFDLVQWFPSDEALKTMKYANEAEVLRQALELISLREPGG